MPESPGYSAVRALLRILEEKGHVKHRELGVRYVYTPTIPRDKAGRLALLRLRETFFNGSRKQSLATLLGVSAREASPQQLDRMAGLIAKTKKGT
jgi:BlaI family penicillinase repressor